MVVENGSMKWLGWCKLAAWLALLLGTAASGWGVELRSGQLLSLGREEIEQWLDLSRWQRGERLGQVLDVGKGQGEVMGRLIYCVGICRLYRGPGFIKGKSRSLLREGDELMTSRNSYGWVFFLDGTLLRVSPESMVAFKEFNVGRKAFLLSLRLNQGHIFVANRDPSPLVVQKLLATDRMFIPLPLRGLFQEKPLGHQGQSGLATPLPGQGEVAGERFEQLNQQVAQNATRLQFRPTWTLISMANGDIYGQGLHMELFAQMGGASFFQHRKPSWHPEVRMPFRAVLWYRGYSNQKVSQLTLGETYRMGPLGRKLQQGVKNFFIQSQQLLKRIPGILMVREKWLPRYAGALHGANLGAEALSKATGHRLWEGRELYQRMKFLRLYTRQVTTAQGYEMRRYQKTYGIEPVSPGQLPEKYFLLALRRYMRALDRQ